MWLEENYNVKHFPSDNTKLAEMEFYLVDELECDLTIFHPYRTLLTLCKKEISDSASLFGSEEGEADEAGVGIGAEDGPRYWGTGEGQLEMSDGALQTAWFILNDTYRSELCLLYPPHIIAIAALYLTLIFHRPTRDTILTQLPSEDGTRHQPPQPPEPVTPTPQPRRSSRQAHQPPTPIETPKKPQDPITFLAELNVSLPLVATVAQEIISLYTLWDRYKEDALPDAPKSSREQGQSPVTGTASGSTSPAKRSAPESRSSTSMNDSNSNAATPTDAAEDSTELGGGEGSYVTPTMLSALLLRMREARLSDISHPASGKTVAINKVLERAQAAG